jgi:hypothetical protein
LYVSSGKANQRTSELFKVNIATGKMEPWKSFGAEVRAGVNGVGAPEFSSDGSAYAYVYVRVLSEAYVVTGLK